MSKASQLTVTVTPELEAFIAERVASGRFTTPSEVVREGLRLLEVREHEREAVLDEIRREIAIGIQDARAGNLSDGEEFFAELEREGPPTT